jgi:hypothetical protein
MFHYVEPNEELKQKKRVVEKLIKANKVDRGLGLTKPEANRVEELLRACEDIETQGTIVLKSLSQSVLKNSHVAQEGIQRFYVVIRKGISALARSTFKQTPITDINNLTDYRDSINTIMVALNETFNLLNEEVFGNEALKGRTLEEYEAQTGRPYRPPISAKALSESINKTISKEQKRKSVTSGIVNIYEILNKKKQELKEIDDRIQQTTDLRDAFVARRDGYRDQALFLYRDYDNKTPTQQANIDLRVQAVRQNILREQQKIDDIDVALDELEKEKRTLPTTIQNIERQLDKQLAEQERLPETTTQPLSELEYQNQLMFEKQAEVVNADFSLVMKDLNLFLNSLTDGLIRYKSGISSQLSKSQTTNYRTPTQQAEVKYGGIHKRFL